MKILICLLLMIFFCAGYAVRQEENKCELNKEAVFILNQFEQDTTLQRYVLDVNYRTKVKHCVNQLK